MKENNEVLNLLKSKAFFNSVDLKVLFLKSKDLNAIEIYHSVYQTSEFNSDMFYKEISKLVRFYD